MIGAMRKKKKEPPPPEAYQLRPRKVSPPPREPFVLWVHLAVAVGLPTQSAILDLATFWQPLPVDPFVEIFIIRCPAMAGITCEMASPVQAREALEAGQALARCRSVVNREGKWLNTFELKLPKNHHRINELALCLMARDERIFNTPRDIGLVAVRLADLKV
ncbi:hypothetical protein FOZ62_011788, partial [Perkinsus olseni]